MSIYIHKNDEQQGPYSLEEIHQGLENGYFSIDDMAFTDGCTEWVPLNSLIDVTPTNSDQDKSSTNDEAKSPTKNFSSMVTKLITDEQDPAVVDKILNKSKELLTTGEEVDYIAVQKKPVVTIAPDAILLTNKRLMIVRPKMMGMTFDDHLWREVEDVHMSEQMLSARITCKVISGKQIEIDSIPKKQARRIYTYAQDMEEKMYEERRRRDMEEKRAGATGFVMQSPTQAPLTEQVPQPKDDPIEVLGKLKQMLDAGLIEQSEYNTKKSDLLDRM